MVICIPYIYPTINLNNLNFSYSFFFLKKINNNFCNRTKRNDPTYFKLISRFCVSLFKSLGFI